MKIGHSENFKKRYKNLESAVRNKFKKQFVLFSENLFYPSLHTEKLQPKEKNIWSFRVDKNYRVIFTFEGSNTVVLLDIGPHDIYRKK